MDRRSEAILLARRLEAWGDRRRWSGTDPYDALNATRWWARPLKRRPLSRRLLIQAVKRSPVNLRPALAIEPAVSAASLALAASSYARRGFLDGTEADRRLVDSLNTLERLRSPAFPEPSWGYHFDFQSRAVYYHRGEPNTIATSLAANALLDAYERLGDTSLLDRAGEVAEFLMRRVGQTESEWGAYFGYHPGDRTPIHNSNTLTCAVLARVSAATADDRMAVASEAGLRYTLAHQRPDGSWPYGEQAGLEWVDNFHTGYVLDSLRACIDAGIGGTEAENAWHRGVEFYRRDLFLADGTPKYFASKTYPIDAMCVAQGIQTLAIAAPHAPSCAEGAWRVFDFALRRMLGPDGMPVFQRRRMWTNGAHHIRWVVAPMLLALAHLISLDEGAASAEAPVAEEAIA